MAVKVLTMVAEAALKGSVGEAAKEAYVALKRGIVSLVGGDVAALDLKAPATVAKEIDELEPAKQTDIKSLVLALTAALQNESRPIAAEFHERVKAAEIELRDLTVSGPDSRGLVFHKEVTAKDKLTIAGLNVSNSPGKTTR
jgi:hypothetical protein